MHNFLLATLLLLPSVLIANKSVSGSNTGYFLLYFLVANSVNSGIFGPLYFIYGALFFLMIVFIFRRKLELNKWSLSIRSSISSDRKDYRNTIKPKLNWILLAFSIFGFVALAVKICTEFMYPNSYGTLIFYSLMGTSALLGVVGLIISFKDRHMSDIKK